MSNPFKKIAGNSRDTAKKWESFKGTSTVDSRKCPRCGAPRPVNTNIANCSYCGFKFMDTDVIIHHEKGHENDKETGTDKPLG